MEKLIQQIRKLRSGLQKALLISVSSVQSEQKDRIHKRGLDSKGQRIGKYSEKPISISKKRQVRNTGQTYFPKGYREYKQRIGQESNFVTLENFGQMMRDYTFFPINKKSIVQGFKNPINAKKATWAEENFDTTIYDWTEEEENIFNKVFDYELNRLLNG